MTRTALSVGIGAASALAVDAVTRRYLAPYQLSLHSAVLVGAAVVYPATHSRFGAEPAERRREAIGVAAYAVLAVAAARSRRRAPVLAAGWASHALFDAVHDRSASSLLPDWYPAFCAGYDVAMGAALLRPDGSR